MMFTISGKISEKESGLPLPGLKVRAYDKDLFFDDLLGNATTAADGTFIIEYRLEDFRELFESKPDIYLKIYSRNYIQITNTEKSVRWNAGEVEQFDISISRQDLPGMPPQIADDTVKVDLQLNESDIEIKQSGNYKRASLRGFTIAGLPGEPAIPSQVRYLLLAKNSEILELQVEKGESITITDIDAVMPVQEPYPDLGINSDEFSDGHTFRDFAPSFTPLQPQYTKSKSLFPQQLVRLLGQEDFASSKIIAVRVTPVQYDAVNRVFLFYPNLKFIAKLKNNESAEKNRPETSIGYAEAQVLRQVQGMGLVHAAHDIGFPGKLVWEEAQHVIITDNYYWPNSIDRGDGTKRAPNMSERGAAVAGDMIAEFDRLAQWKTAKGVRSKLVTVSQIIGGTFGDMTQSGFARDTPEVIRNFIKYAKSHWKTLYVLMAGDHNVVPIRHLCGSSLYHTIGVVLDTVNPPAERCCFFLAGNNTSKLHPEFTPNPSDLLATYTSGLRIPFNREAGSGQLGWYFTNENDFNTKNDGFKRLPIEESSRFIIVEGPNSDINDHFYWLRDVNSIPSDFYYSSIVGPGYSQASNHDFDLNNNEMYGQYAGENSLDGVSWSVDVYVGRASVESALEAKAFVDKTINYEKLVDNNGQAISTNYLRRVIYSSTLWGREGWRSHLRQTNLAIPPDQGFFTHAAGATETHLHLNFDIGLIGNATSFQLIARTGANDTLISYNTAANATTLGWFFCTDNSYTVQSAITTRFVRILGPQASIDPNRFDWDVVGLELSALEKEELRQLIKVRFPDFNDVQRYYDDYFDLTAPPDIDRLISADLKNDIDQGCHFLSLTGHGGSNGCCGIDSSVQNFSNTNAYFVAFADSCSTARIDANDSMAERLTNDPDGGAVCYVGNTRYSWISVGDNYERFFWSKLAGTGRPGIAAGFRLAEGGLRSPWVVYAQNLFGDPELPVYTCIPKTFNISHDRVVYWGQKMTIRVFLGEIPVENAMVTIMVGWRGGLNAPEQLSTKFTNQFGNVSFKLPARSKSKAQSLQLTVTRARFKPFTTAIPLQEFRTELQENAMQLNSVE